MAEQRAVILMVDDEPAIRELMKLRLEDAGFEVITAVDGRDGLERYKENKDLVQVVVTDLEMPTMSGADMLRQIFKITPAMKVIVASGQLGDPQFEELCTSAPAIHKPYTARELTDAVRMLV
jgi:sigma-B regulation protein RsbU (phosphoserine phosphatase)